VAAASRSKVAKASSPVCVVARGLVDEGLDEPFERIAAGYGQPIDRVPAIAQRHHQQAVVVMADAVGG
jgi:hypothetical protein